MLWEKKNLSCMKQQSETSELCPALRERLCVCPRGEQSLFSVSCHYSLGWMLLPVRSGFVFWMLWGSVCTSSSALVPQGCPERQLSRRAPRGCSCGRSSPESSRAGAVLQDQSSWPFRGKGKGRTTHKEEAARGGKEALNAQTAAVIRV